MKKFCLFLAGVSVMSAMPVIAGAAGTYYNGNLYKNPQYGAGNRNGGYYNTYGGGRGYGQQSALVRPSTTNTTQTKSSNKKTVANQPKQGFNLDMGLSHELASWRFDMKEAGSQLHYDNLSWNVLSADGVYYFGDSTPVQVKFGARYGMQFDKSSMIDDDVSNGPYAYEDLVEGRQSGHAMSIGTSKDGSQMGFNAAFGLTDFFKSGRFSATPSIGYRYLKYKLTTEQNYGLTMDTFSPNSSQTLVNCISTGGGETQCDPSVFFLFYDAAGNYLDYAVTGRLETDDGLTDILVDVGPVPENTAYVTIDLGDTYYYEQTGTSHKYETEWAGPYVALDMEYNIDNDNIVSGGVELGLPIYSAKGDQPYRIDWAHPTSVEDKGNFGDAIHIGLNTMWSTKLTDSVAFSLGFTYDYYKVKNATAKTYLNPTYYQPILDYYQEEYDIYADAIDAGYVLSDAEKALFTELSGQLNVLKSQKNAGWMIESKSEINSIYKSMGIRAGISVKF